MNLWVKNACITLALLGLALPSFAKEQEEVEIKNWDFTLGIFQAIQADYLGSSDFEGVVLPFFDLTYHWDSHTSYAFLRSNEGLGLQTRLGQGILGASIGYRGERNSDENTKLEGLENVDATPTANLFFRYGHNEYNGGILISKGLSDDNRGTLVKLYAGCNCKFKDKWYGSLNGFVTWADETYMNDYMGVKASEATVNRAAYTPSSGLLNYGINGGISYQLDENQGLMLGSSVYKLGKEARNSTFVEEDYGSSLTFGYIYRF